MRAESSDGRAETTQESIRSLAAWSSIDKLPAAAAEYRRVNLFSQYQRRPFVLLFRGSGWRSDATDARQQFLRRRGSAPNYMQLGVPSLQRLFKSVTLLALRISLTATQTKNIVKQASDRTATIDSEDVISS